MITEIKYQGTACALFALNEGLMDELYWDKGRRMNGRLRQDLSVQRKCYLTPIIENVKENDVGGDKR